MAINHDQIKKLIGEKEEVIIFEIGCADGRDTRKFLQTFGDNLKLYTFDPEPVNIKALSEIGATNYRGESNNDIIQDPRNIFHPYAMCDEDKTIIFNRSRDIGYPDKGEGVGRYSGSIHDPVNQASMYTGILFDQTVEAQGRSLDSFCKEKSIEHIDFIWMDTQGAEREVLGGMKKSYTNIDYIYTEYYNEEMYKDQIYLNGIVEMLSENFDLLATFPFTDCQGGDALFKNKKIP
jgi:FkbM family methyltransferase